MHRLENHVVQRVFWTYCDLNREHGVVEPRRTADRDAGAKDQLTDGNVRGDSDHEGGSSRHGVMRLNCRL